MQNYVVTPDWVKDAVFYQIFPDRFAHSTRLSKPSNLEAWDSPPTSYGFKGGDLYGVIEKLDYLQDLGINALYFCPIFASTANHRYHTHDFYTVDPILGGNKALQELLQAAHQRGIKVMLDGVFNHASRGFLQFSHTLENGQDSPYLDWFTFKDFPVNAYSNRKPNYKAWWDLPALPKFNIATPAVREFILDVATYWMEFGIDGWRLDVPNEIDDDEFWREFRTRVKKVNPEGYICGEIWDNATRWLKGDMFDSVMNYLFTKACLGFFPQQIDKVSVQGTGEANLIQSRLSAPQFGQTIQKLLAMYPPQVTSVQLNLLDSHDTPRFITTTGDDETALRLATMFQMTYPGAPSVYYGDEIGLEGAKDPDCRRSFPWDANRWNTTLLDYFKKLIALRHQFAALRRGSYDELYAQNKLYIYGRNLGEERLVIALNADSKPADFPSNEAGNPYLPAGATLLNLLEPVGSEMRQVRVEPNGKVNLKVPARSGVILHLPPA